MPEPNIIDHKDREESDYQLEQRMIIGQILLVSSSGHVKRLIIKSYLDDISSQCFVECNSKLCNKILLFFF